MNVSEPDETSNRLLALLTDEERERIRPHLRRVSLSQGDVIFEAGEPALAACFPTNGIVSIVCTSAGGAGVEVGMVGYEGVAGVPIVLGDGEPGNRRAVVQVAGEGFMLGAEPLREEFGRCGSFQRVLLRYTQAYLTFITQSVFCQAFHALDERLARWLAESRFRMKSDELRLTQEYVAQMIGVRRAGVTEAMSRLREKGVIEHARGTIVILDPEGLAATACECCPIIRAEFDRLFGSPAEMQLQ